MDCKTEKGRMEALLTAYEVIDQIRDDMEPIFGVQCGGGHLSDLDDIIVRVIEGLTKYPEDMTDRIDMEDYFIDLIHNKSVDRAEALLNPKKSPQNFR